MPNRDVEIRRISPPLHRLVLGKINSFFILIWEILRQYCLGLLKIDFTMGKSQTEVMGVDLSKIIKKLKKHLPAIHDLKLQTESNLHQYLVDLKYGVNKHNKCILFTMTTPSPNIWVKVVVYPSSFQVDVACSQEPFKCNIDGMENLTDLLAQVRQFLLQKAGGEAQIPEIGTWRLDHCHFNIDGDHMTCSGKQFNITFESLAGEFERLYTKEMHNGRTIPRLEQIMTPRKPLLEVIQQLLRQEVKMI